MLVFQKEQFLNDKKITKLFKRKNLNLDKAKSSTIFDKDCLVR